MSVQYTRPRLGADASDIQWIPCEPAALSRTSPTRTPCDACGGRKGYSSPYNWAVLWLREVPGMRVYERLGGCFRTSYLQDQSQANSPRMLSTRKTTLVSGWTGQH